MRTRISNMLIGRCALTILWLLFVSGLANAKVPNVKLEGFMELRIPQVTTGEPLVATVGLRNVGDIPFVTAYASPGIFRGNSEIDCTVTTLAGDTILISTDSPNDAVVIEPNPEFIVKHGGLVPAIEPGESVIAKRTVLLVQTVGDRRFWLRPGTYKIQAKIRIQRLAEEFMTAAETFTVKPLAPEDQGVLSIFTPDLAWVLQGQGTRRERDAAVAKVEDLHKKFPRAPHRQYLEFQLLWFTPTREEKLAKANAYLEEFPKSPYVDDRVPVKSSGDIELNWLDSRDEFGGPHTDFVFPISGSRHFRPLS